MAEAAPGKEEEFRSTNQTAFVVGHTGGTGSALVEELVNRNIFQRVVLIGRRKLDKYEGETYNMLEGFKRVDHDYMMKVAELAKAGGCRHFSIVSSTGADKNSSLLYNRVKGEVEAECTDLGFQRLSIFRPGLLLAEREERRVSEGFFRTLLAPVIYFKPTLLSVPVETVAKAMVNTVLEPCQEPVEIIDNKSIHRLAQGKNSGK